jgi:hypothetical protein
MAPSVKARMATSLYEKSMLNLGLHFAEQLDAIRKNVGDTDPALTDRLAQIRAIIGKYVELMPPEPEKPDQVS